MNYGEFTEGINILVACFPRSITEAKVRLLFDSYFTGLNFDPNVWIKACKTLGETKERFPTLVIMKSAYWEAVKGKKPEVAHTDCELCSNGLRSYYKKKNGTVYIYCALCDCELGAQYSPNLKNGKHWATWAEKEKQGKFIQHEKEIIPEFVPFSEKYADVVPF